MVGTALLVGCGLITDVDGFKVGAAPGASSETTDAAGPPLPGNADGATETIVDADAAVEDAEGGPNDSGPPGCTKKVAGPMTATSATTSGSGNAWSNPTKVFVQDDDPAEATGCCSGDFSQTLLVRGFSFNVPGNAKILGVKVEVRAKGNSSDKEVRLTPNGTAAGSDFASANGYNGDFTTRAYGGESNLWGLILSPALVNAQTFGVSFRSQKPPFVSASGYVDLIRATVYYCE
jgi:hypothetical protein